MAVAAIQPIVADVMLVTKLDGLLPFDPLASVPGRAIQFRRHPQSGNKDKDGPVDRQFRERVCTVMKNLWHRRSFANPLEKNSAFSKFRAAKNERDRWLREKLLPTDYSPP
jgi:hypothetical protein